MKTLVAITSLAAALALTGTGRGQTKTDSTLTKLMNGFAAAYNAKDAAKAASFYAEDAVLMPPNHPMVKGRATIQAGFERQIQAGFTNLQLKSMEAAIVGSYAFEAGTAIVTLPDGGIDSTKRLVIFKRVGNEWKIAYDIYNTDAPPAPQKHQSRKHDWLGPANDRMIGPPHLIEVALFAVDSRGESQAAAEGFCRASGRQR